MEQITENHLKKLYKESLHPIAPAEFTWNEVKKQICEGTAGYYRHLLTLATEGDLVSRQKTINLTATSYVRGYAPYATFSPITLDQIFSASTAFLRLGNTMANSPTLHTYLSHLSQQILFGQVVDKENRLFRLVY